MLLILAVTTDWDQRLMVLFHALQEIVQKAAASMEESLHSPRVWLQKINEKDNDIYSNDRDDFLGGVIESLSAVLPIIPPEELMKVADTFVLLEPRLTKLRLKFATKLSHAAN